MSTEYPCKLPAQYHNFQIPSLKQPRYYVIMQKKADMKKVRGADTLKFAEKVDFARLKSKTDTLDIDELETTALDLSKLRDRVKNKVVEKTMYNKLV